jgi:hypothetical protein
MTINLIILILSTIFLLIALARRKKTLVWIFLIVLIITLLFKSSILANLFGNKWNSITSIESEQIGLITISPSQPEWEVNLVDTSIIITNDIATKDILSFLQNSNLYSPSHPIRKWETNIILFTTSNDSVSVRIVRLQDGETIIYSNKGIFRNDELAPYLEKLFQFSKPVKRK